MATGPDANSIAVTNTSLVSLAKLGLRKHVMLLTDSWTTCELLNRPPGKCFWSSRMLRTRPADSLTLRQFWDLRFRAHRPLWPTHTTIAPRAPVSPARLCSTGFYFIKKNFMVRLVQGGYSVLQADTDTVWIHDPFIMLRQMRTSSIICMRDVGLANAGIIYARPGSSQAIALLEEVAWRVQLMQNHPEIVSRIVPFARPPYYANSDDQTLLNDAIVGAVLGNRTFMGSTARYEARNRYNPKAPEWAEQPESKQERAEMRMLWRSQKSEYTVVPWDNSRKVRYMTLPIGDGDHVAFAPRALFAHLPFTPASAITHLTAARGYSAKVSSLKRIGMWNPLGSQEDPPEGTSGSVGAPQGASASLSTAVSSRSSGGGGRGGGGRGHAHASGRGGAHGAHGGRGAHAAKAPSVAFSMSDRLGRLGFKAKPTKSADAKAAKKEAKAAKREIALPVTVDAAASPSDGQGSEGLPAAPAGL